MPEHMLRCHAFLARSLLDPLRGDYEHDDEVEDEDHSLQSVHLTAGTSVHPAVFVRDRSAASVIEDNAKMGQAVFTASKPLHSSGTLGQLRVTSVAVREHGTNKYSNVLRFMHAASLSVSKELDRWIAVPKSPVSMEKILFSTHGDPLSKSCETFLLQTCFPLTLGQRCADWFTLRQFRVTGTNAGLVLQKDPVFRTQVGLPPQSDSTERTLRDWFIVFIYSWFSGKVSTELMMRGSANEEPVIEHLRNMPFVKEVYDVGMLALTQRPELVCSPDGITILKMDNSIGTHLGGDGDFEVDGHGVCIAPVEVKTKVSPNTLGTAIGLTCADTLFCFPGDTICQKYVEPEHLTQVAQQATTLGAKLAVYVIASETGVLYVVILRIPDSFKQVCQQALTKVSEHAVCWAHTAEGQIPQFAPRDSVGIIRGRWCFWRVVNEHVKANGPFLLLKLFKHTTRSFYSKTNGGVDGATHQRAILRSSTSHLQWEQKLVTQLLNTVCINAFIVWRIFERRDILQPFSDFNSLELYRNELNKVQSTADFMLDATLDLLAHSQAIHASEDTEEESIDSVGVDEKRALVVLAARRKRRRILFFNSEKGVKLRLYVTGHIPTTAKNLYGFFVARTQTLLAKDGEVIMRALSATFSRFTYVYRSILVYAKVSGLCGIPTKNLYLGLLPTLQSISLLFKNLRDLKAQRCHRQ